MTIVYDAFISYSHARDKPVAAALQGAIQRLGKPWYRRRALRVFRDGTSLAATPELWPTIERALAASRWLVLLASPQAAASRWVGKEVDYWLAHKSRDTLLIAVTDGTLAWDEDASDFVRAEASPLPATLAGRFGHEPKWVDLTAFREQPAPRDPRFLDAAADVAAAVRGVPKEDLLSEEMRQQRRALALAWSAAVVLLVLGAFAAVQWAEAVAQKRVAQAQRDRAERALGSATRTANVLVIDLASEFRDRTGIPADLVRGVLGRAGALQQQLIGSGEAAPALLESALNGLDLLVLTWVDLGNLEAALSAAQKGRDLVLRLKAAEPGNPKWDRSLSVADNKIGEVLLRAGRVPEAIAAFRDALAAIRPLSVGSPSNLDYKRDLAVTLSRLADALAAIGQREEALATYREALAGDEARLAAGPEDAAVQRDASVAYEKIGDMLTLSQPAEALPYYRRSVALREKRVAADPGSATAQRDLATGYDRLGDATLAGGEVEAAIETFRQALARREALVQADPANVLWQQEVAISCNKIGEALLRRERVADALTWFRRSVDIEEAIAGRDPANREWQRNLSVSQNRLGDALAAAGKTAEALAVYERVVAVREALVAADPANAGWQEDAANALDRVGAMRAALGRRAEATADLRRSFAIRERLLDRDPDNARWQRGFVVTANQLGDLLTASGDAEAASAIYERSLAVSRRLAALDPTNGIWQTDLAFALNRVAEMHRIAGRLDEALATLRESLAIERALVAAQPADAVWRRNLSIVQEGIGRNLLAQDEADAALATFGEALSIREALAAEAPGDPRRTFDLFLIVLNVADAQRKAGRVEPAVEGYRRAAALLAGPAGAGNDVAGASRADALYRLADLLIASGRRADAVDPLRQLLAIGERYAARETESGEVRKRVVLTLIALARSGDAPRERLVQARELVGRLAAEGRLGDDAPAWAQAVEDELAKIE